MGLGIRLEQFPSGCKTSTMGTRALIAGLEALCLADMLNVSHGCNSGAT